MPSNTCEFRVGRLMEINVAGGYRSVEDIDEMMAMMTDRVAALAPQQSAKRRTRIAAIS
jgi:deoxyribose-phosphate aldolase